MHMIMAENDWFGNSEKGQVRGMWRASGETSWRWRNGNRVTDVSPASEHFNTAHLFIQPPPILCSKVHQKERKKKLPLIVLIDFHPSVTYLLSPSTRLASQLSKHWDISWPGDGVGWSPVTYKSSSPCHSHGLGIQRHPPPQRKAPCQRDSTRPCWPHLHLTLVFLSHLYLTPVFSSQHHSCWERELITQMTSQPP